MMANAIRQIPFGRPIVAEDESRAVAEVLRSGFLTHGPKVKEFEKLFAKYTGARHAVAVSSCTAALHLSLMGIGIKPGDEVIVPAQTHTATAHAVELCGGLPIFADVDRETANIDPDQIALRLSPRTRAIIVVHFVGLACDMDAICDLAASRGVEVVEDCALAIGATYRGQNVGHIGLAGCFSFYPIKHITTGEGGMMTTDREEVALLASKQRAFGIDRSVEERQLPGMYDVGFLGNNYRMTEIGAAIGLVQMKRLEEMNAVRHANYRTLRAYLSEIREVTLLQDAPDGSQSGHFCLPAIFREDTGVNRSVLIEKLNERGVGTSIYYGCPVPLMSFYRKKYGFQPGDFPVAEFIAARSIAFPVGAHLDEDDMVYIADTLKECLPQAMQS